MTQRLFLAKKVLNHLILVTKLPEKGQVVVQ